MRFNRLNISKDKILEADILNSINGGISQPRVVLEREEEQYLLTVKIPGVNPEKVEVRIKNNRLFIYHHITVKNREVESIPFNIGFVLIPYDVNIEGISAEYKNSEFLITLPFNDLAGGYDRSIPIKGIE